MAPTVKVNKATMYKMISYKGVSGGKNNYSPLTAAQRLPQIEKSFGKGMGAVTAGINSLGQTLNSIARSTEFTLSGWKSSIKSQISDNKLLVKKEKIAERGKVKREKKRDKEEKDRRKKTQRDEAENKTEKDPLLKRIGSAFAEKTKAVGKGLFGTIISLFGNLIGTFISYNIFDWISKNPKKVTAFFKVIEGIGKFVFNVVGFLSGMYLTGLTNFLENPISLKGFFGIFQFILGATPLFAAFAFLKNPLKGVKVLGSIISKLGNGLKSLFGFGSKEDKLKQFKLKKATGHRFGKVGKFMEGKVGKGLLAGGAAVGAFGSVKAAGGSTSEAGGAAVGAGAGQMAGAAIGAATGIPGAGALGGMIGSMAGGTVGKAVGGMIEPIVKPIGDFFKMIGDTFGGVVEEIKKPMEEFFTVLGEVLGGIIEAIKPHMPIISKIISTGIKVLFWPLFLGMKALTAVLKLFTGGKGDKGQEGDKGSKPTDKIKETPGGPGGGDQPKTTSKKFKATLVAGLPVGDRLLPIQMSMIGASKAMSEKNFQNLAPHVQEMYFKQLAEEGNGNPVEPAPQPGTEKKGDSKGGFDFAKGGLFKSGGWISGPQSGYPVSLDGGRSTSFIGHGTEWVGAKRAAGGQAFVVPFDTPATRQRPGLTSTRLGEAKRQGYALPQAYDQRLRGYASGGKTIAEGAKIPIPQFLNMSTPREEMNLTRGGGGWWSKVKGAVTQKDDEGKPSGIARWLAGAADTLTGNRFDLDKRGSMMDGASRLKDNIGQRLEDAKQRENSEKFKQLQEALDGPQVVAMEEQAEAIGTGGGDDVPFVIPSDHELAADKYIKPKYGLLPEFMTDPVEFM